MENKILLQSFDKHSEKAYLDLASGYLKKTSLLKNFSTRGKVCSGKYAVVRDNLACLYKINNKLFFQYQDHEKYEIDVNTLSRIVHENSMNRFQLLQGIGNLVLEVIYSPPNPDPPLYLDPTPFIELEDFDFMLFVKNIVNDRFRQERMFSATY